MANLLENVAPMLEPGEQLQYAFTGQTGMRPTWGWLTLWLTVANTPRIVAVTDRRIAVFQAGRWRKTRVPKKLLYSVPRSTQLAHTRKGWSKIRIGDEGIWMSRRLYPLLDKANANAAA